MRSVAFRFLLLLALLSTPLTAQWKQTNGPYGGTDLIIQLGSLLFSATSGSLYQSADSGTTWSAISKLPVTGYVSSIIEKNSFLFLASFEGVYRSSDSGRTWIMLAGLPHFQRARFSIGKNALFITERFEALFTGPQPMYRTTDDGITWSRVDSALMDIAHPMVFVTIDSILYAAGNWVLKSSDDGLSW